jgi:hypothetical protein
MFPALLGIASSGSFSLASAFGGGSNEKTQAKHRSGYAADAQLWLSRLEADITADLQAGRWDAAAGRIAKIKPGWQPVAPYPVRVPGDRGSKKTLNLVYLASKADIEARRKAWTGLAADARKTAETAGAPAAGLAPTPPPAQPVTPGTTPVSPEATGPASGGVPQPALEAPALEPPALEAPALEANTGSLLRDIVIGVVVSLVVAMILED